MIPLIAGILTLGFLGILVKQQRKKQKKSTVPIKKK